MGLGYAQRYTYDYVRHGTKTLFADLDLATANVVARREERHRHQELLAFLRLIDRETRGGLDIHFVGNNYATYKHAKVRA